MRHSYQVPKTRAILSPTRDPTNSKSELHKMLTKARPRRQVRPRQTTLLRDIFLFASIVHRVDLPISLMQLRQRVGDQVKLIRIVLLLRSNPRLEALNTSSERDKRNHRSIYQLAHLKKEFATNDAPEDILEPEGARS